MRRKIAIGVGLLLWAAPALAEIPLNRVQVLGSNPAALSFPVTARLESFGVVPNRMTIRSTGTSAWPPVPVGDAQQSATLWVFLNINGQWYASGAERLRPNQTNGDKPVADPSQGGLSTLIGGGWLYDAGRWGPMAGYNPKPGEHIGVMLVAGSTRSDDRTPLQARTGVVEVIWPDAAGRSPMMEVWREGDTVTPGPTPVPTPTPMPQPDLQPIYQELATLRAWIESVHTAVAGHVGLIDELGRRLTTLESRPVVTRCLAAARLGFATVPISCRLE